jgi:hypothetical protein
MYNRNYNNNNNSNNNYNNNNNRMINYIATIKILIYIIIVAVNLLLCIRIVPVINFLLLVIWEFKQVLLMMVQILDHLCHKMKQTRAKILNYCLRKGKK